MATITVTSDLPPWSALRGGFRDQDNLGLLLGNGASRALWPNFEYPSLYRIACDPQRTNPLSPIDQALFRDMETENFEAVLSALATTRMVCGHLKKEFGDVDDRYQSIRTSLIEAIRTVHVPFEQVPQATRQRLGDLLSHYKYIYTANYDLLLYWALMETKDKWNWKDFLWGHENCFESADSNEWASGRFVLYLHGALHLYHDLYGGTRKKVFQEDGADLLSQFDVAGEWIPLFVSEGRSRDKLRSIRRNDYLSFAYWKFSYHRGPLVVFGSGLSKEFDQHVLDAMKQWPDYDRSRLGPGAVTRRVAVSIHPFLRPQEIIEFKNRIISELPRHSVLFFDSTTHPLGDPTLQIVPSTL